MKTDDYAIVQIHHQFPPLQSPGVIRNFFLARTFQKKFKNSYIITGSVPPSKRDSFLPIQEYYGVIKSVNYFDFRQVFQFFKKSKSATINEKVKKNVFAKWFLKFRNTYPFILLFGDGGFNYAFNAIREIRKILNHHPKAIIFSSYPPYIDHFIASKIKKKYPKTIWVADFRDLHLEPIYQSTFFPKYQYRQNLKMLRNADLICSISDGLVHQLKKYNRPTLTLYNGLRTAISNSSNHYKKFTLAYTGSLYKSFRDPAILFSSINNLLTTGIIQKEHLQIIYAGLHHKEFTALINEYELKELYTDLGFIERKQAIEIQQKAHINILLSSSSEEHYGVLTGKFFEYLAALNPILLLINGPRDVEFEKIFSGLKAGLSSMMKCSRSI